MATKKKMNKSTKSDAVMYKVNKDEIGKKYAITMPIIRQNVNLIIVKLSNRIML